MAEVLLTSEAFVKSVCPISENTAGKYMQASILEAQEVRLRGILGDNLTDALKAKVADDSIKDAANAAYAALLQKARFYIAYTAVSFLLHKVTYKIGNFGVAKATDENLQTATPSEIDRQRADWQNLADDQCRKLQMWVCENSASFPELSESDAYKIRQNLYSAASCHIWLGGVRGKTINGGGCCR